MSPWVGSTGGSFPRSGNSDGAWSSRGGLLTAQRSGTDPGARGDGEWSEVMVGSGRRAEPIGGGSGPGGGPSLKMNARRPDPQQQKQAEETRPESKDSGAAPKPCFAGVWAAWAASCPHKPFRARTDAALNQSRSGPNTTVASSSSQPHSQSESRPSRDERASGWKGQVGPKGRAGVRRVRPLRPTRNDLGLRISLDEVIPQGQVAGVGYKSAGASIMGTGEWRLGVPLNV